jgi:hypothetical protein
VPRLLGQRPVRGELACMLVKLDQQYTAGEPSAHFAADCIADHFAAAR